MIFFWLYIKTGLQSPRGFDSPRRYTYCLLGLPVGEYAVRLSPSPWMSPCPCSCICPVPLPPPHLSHIPRKQLHGPLGDFLRRQQEAGKQPCPQTEQEVHTRCSFRTEQDSGRAKVRTLRPDCSDLDLFGGGTNHRRVFQSLSAWLLREALRCVLR